MSSSLDRLDLWISRDPVRSMFSVSDSWQPLALQKSTCYYRPLQRESRVLGPWLAHFVFTVVRPLRLPSLVRLLVVCSTLAYPAKCFPAPSQSARSSWVCTPCFGTAQTIVIPIPRQGAWVKFCGGERIQSI